MAIAVLNAKLILSTIASVPLGVAWLGVVK